jgi:hypothetical protein
MKPTARLSLLFLWIAVFLISLPINPPSFASLLLRFRRSETMGVVTGEADPKNHNYVTCEYTVNGKTYTEVGYGPDHQLGKEWRRGERTLVSYFPPLPQVATMANEMEQKTYFVWGLTMSGIMATFATFGVHWKYFKSKGSKGATGADVGRGRLP